MLPKRSETEDAVFQLQLNPQDPSRSTEIALEVDSPSTRTVLVQMRNLLQHHRGTLARVSETQLTAVAVCEDYCEPPHPSPPSPRPFFFP